MNNTFQIRSFLVEDDPVRPAPPRCPVADSLRWRRMPRELWLAELKEHMATCRRCERIHRDGWGGVKHEHTLTEAEMEKA